MLPRENELPEKINDAEIPAGANAILITYAKVTGTFIDGKDGKPREVLCGAMARYTRENNWRRDAATHPS